MGLGRVLGAPWVSGGGRWMPLGSLLGLWEPPWESGSLLWRVPGGHLDHQNIVRGDFLEIIEGKIHIFPRFSVCDFCEFDVFMEGSWAPLGGFCATPRPPR